jgi:hypothetical protein
VHRGTKHTVGIRCTIAEDFVEWRSAVKDSGAGADGDNGKGIWMAMLGVRLSTGLRESQIILLLALHSAVWVGRIECIVYLDNIIITVRNVSMSVKEI